MKRFPLEPLSRVRDLRLDAQQKKVAAFRAALDEKERLRDLAKQACTDILEKRQRHQYAIHVATAYVAELEIGWLERAERHRQWIDAEIFKKNTALAAAEREVVKARQLLDEEILVLRRAQAKVDALQTFRGEWTQGVLRENERREEQDSEELFKRRVAL